MNRSQVIERTRKAFRWLDRRQRLAFLLFLLLLAFRSEGPPPGDIPAQAERRVAGLMFNFVEWEARALSGKTVQHLVTPQWYMDESARHDVVLDYLELISEIGHLDSEIDRIYTDPEITDADAATTELRARLAELREEENERQWLAEAIIEEQVASILVDEGFGLLGQDFPPVGLHFTPLPLLLIVSPRDHIENVASIGLRHGLDTARREAIEEEIDAELDVSSLVTGIGGLSAYPSMLLELGSLTWVADVTAHEWTHHYLTLVPLGWKYDGSPETRTINETVASIVGQEIEQLVIARYYPERLPPEPEPVAEGSRDPAEAATPPDPPAFDFRLEMRETRIRVDELLAEGRIEEAEAYMEERRQEFVANGYQIRKLNQAYFAFHGSYASEPGASGADPIGPAVRQLRAQSPDLFTFVTRIGGVTTMSELETLLAESE